MESKTILLTLLYLGSVYSDVSIDCDARVVCTEADRIMWISRQKDFNLLSSLSDKTSFYAAGLRKGHNFCTDDSIAFIADNESGTWPMACVWTGNSGNVSCVPAPMPTHSVFEISESEVISKKLAQVRTAAGCHDDDIKEAYETPELYVCRERCFDLGISPLNWLVFDAGLLLSLFALGIPE
uniref:C-type lectin domain-containing protein n=1 Tax=Panagrellus redivivus TaxID=6233 RepID=A0A7E4W2G0_PANRE